MISLSQLMAYKANGTKFSCLTCYDASFAQAMQNAEVDTILIGDSLGMVVQGQSSTLPVTVDDIAYHTRAVARGNQHALLLADLPFMSYATIPDAIRSATALMQAGAHVVKLEGGAWLAETVRVLAQGGIPSCVHLGLTPQSVNVFGGYKVQGKTRATADQLLADCEAVVAAGAALLLLECVPAQLAREVQAQFAVPVIGIGAGADCDGQVLVMHDMLGLHHGKPARFVRNFMQDANSIEEAFRQFHLAVRQGQYPAAEHTFQIEL
ncbi:MAG: 3-methyl-2-oxobutanoate hydroxymethyltransferase [Pseudomonadota bacterium]|nr:3-methyl-2-oxobutanoate hydroxymethyltransferase [Pseudomonadota bacterium]